ncbi:M1 family metallopeptidase [Stenotrophomonas maltophilia]|uniref:M1 family metallopeptidase n=1 Tax=Stenotrophomonas maltophilia TaxID=40324 RepID=UPI00115E3775|nr:M1 family metallopeptidase [Stenotrophomonas maltophilia]
MNPCKALLPAVVAALLSPAISQAALPAQPATPLTTGSVRVDIATGRVDGDVCASNSPANAQAHFVLNAGLNVARVTDGDGKPVGFDGWYDPSVDGEARVYTLAEPAATLCVQYVGAFPLYPKHDALGDFKGMMAFNGDSARFTEQSAWLPQAFDPMARVRSSESRYDLQVDCAGCRFLYLNGSPAIESAQGRFRSDNARPILLFGGSGPITRTAQVTILNETLPTAKVDALSSTVQKVADVHGRYMGVPLADRPTFLRMVTLNQIERDREGSEWGFATWPTIAMSGSIGNVADSLLAGGEKAERRVQYVAHEMGHYYFGTLNRPQGPYFWVLLESSAEFLSIKALREISGDAAADRYIARLQSAIDTQDKPLPAIDAIDGKSDLGEMYRYVYAPLLLLSLEKQVGEAKMQAFMRGLLAAPSPKSWAELQGIALKAGIDAKAWENWRASCVAGGRQRCQG